MKENSKQQLKDQWSSKWAFILAATGAAVGLGNVWRFPYMAGSNGGSAFVLVYLLCVIVIGLPIMVAEILIGRRAKQNPVSALETLAKESGHTKKWGLLGWWGALALLLVLSFYSVVSGWSIAYLFRSVSGTFSGMNPTQIENFWQGFLANPWQLLAWHTVFMSLTIGVIVRGVKEGLEKATKFMMPALYVILLVLVIYAAMEGDFRQAVHFLFDFKIAKITPIIVVAAMGVGGSFAFVGALYLGRTWFSVLIFPMIVGLTEAMAGLSQVGLLPLIAYLDKLQHWRIIHVEFGIAVIVLATLIFFTVSDKRKEKVKKRNFSVRGELKLILGSPVVWLLSLFCGFTFVFITAIANMWGAPLLAVFYHIPIWRAAVETGMVMLGFTVGCVGIGWVARYVSERLLILVCAILQFVSMMVFWYFEFNLTVAGILLFIIGMATVSLIVIFDVLKKIVPVSSYGVSCGFLNMFFGGFGILISPVIGYIFEVTQDVYLSFVPALVCSFFALVLAVILKVIKIKPIARPGK